MHTHTDPALGLSLVRHHEFVRRLALRLTGDPNEADDVTQDLWLRTLEAPSGRRSRAGRRSESLDEARGLGPFLQSSIRGIAKNRGRAARRRRFHEQAASRAEVEPVRDLALRQEVVAAVLDLTEPFRSTVVRTYELGMTPKEIAEADGVAEATVRTRLFRSHSKLRLTLCSDEERRERLSALALALPAVRSVALKSSGSFVGAALVGAACVGAGIFWLMGAWQPSVKAPKEIRRERALAGLSDISATAGLEAPPPTGAMEDGLADEKQQQPRVSLSPKEHPYWAAVRAARAKVQRYVVDEPAQDAAIRQRVAQALVAPPTWSTEVGLGKALEQMCREASIPVQVSDEAKDGTAPMEPAWLFEPREVSLTDGLALLLNLGESRLHWEVAGGSVQVAQFSELMEFAQEFEYRLDDFLVNPGDLFEGGSVPPPVYGTTISANDLLSSVKGGIGRLARWDLEGEATAEGAAFKFVHFPRGHLRAQAYLDRLRAFRLPLPAEGVPGGVSRTIASKSDRAAFALVQKAGGVAALGNLDAAAFEETLRTLGKERRVGILWTAAARESLATSGEGAGLDFEVLGGCLVITAHGEIATRSKMELWMDLRSTLTGAEFEPSAIAADPHLQEMLQDPGPLVKSPTVAVDYCQRFVSPDSWGTDPANTMRVTEELHFTVQQSPWVLNEIERVMASWQSPR